MRDEPLHRLARSTGDRLGLCCKGIVWRPCSKQSTSGSIYRSRILLVPLIQIEHISGIGSVKCFQVEHECSSMNQYNLRHRSVEKLTAPGEFDDPAINQL